MKKFSIPRIDEDCTVAIQRTIDLKTKPLGALGALEELALQIGTIQQTDVPELIKPHHVVFAADHGIAAEGVSKYPQAVTYQMVLNFLEGGAAINVFCRQHGIGMTIVDAGVIGDFADAPALLRAKVGQGTKNMLREPAMTIAECERAIDAGAGIVDTIADQGTNIIGFGEMGIGNTSAAALLLHAFTGTPLRDCVGRGTGLDDDGVEKKIAVLTRAAELHAQAETPVAILAALGGFEIAMMCGAMLQAAERGMVILVDGFIAGAAFLAAYRMDHAVYDYAIFCHQSDEAGHRTLLDALNAEPILNLGMRLGEGTGCALAFPIVQSAVKFMAEMASFESAGVSTSAS